MSISFIDFLLKWKSHLHTNHKELPVISIPFEAWSEFEFAMNEVFSSVGGTLGYVTENGNEIRVAGFGFRRQNTQDSKTHAPMSDWAKDVIDKLLEEGGGYMSFEPTAAALHKVARENKAAGMREAAKIAWQQMDKNKPSDSPDNTWAFHSVQKIFSQANKIEHGETTE